MKYDETIESIIRRFGRFSENLEHGDSPAAAEEFARTCHMLRRTDLQVPTRTLMTFMEMWIDIFWQCRRHDMMLKAADEAERLFGKDPEWTFARGEAFFYLGRFKEAREIFENLTTEDFDDPILFFHLGCLAERDGHDAEARRFFQTACRLDPKGYQVPAKLNGKEVTEIYERCLEDLPESIRMRLSEVPIYIDPLPSDDLILSVDPPLDPLTMGVFMGNSLIEGESSWASDQPRIVLFHKNIAKASNDFELVEDELRKTLFHEIGHFLGFSEEELEEMGLG